MPLALSSGPRNSVDHRRSERRQECALSVRGNFHEPKGVSEFKEFELAEVLKNHQRLAGGIKLSL